MGIENKQLVAEPTGPAGDVLEKELLRDGLWQTQGGRWAVDRQVLRELVGRWRQQQRQGKRVPVVWNHSDDARDKIGIVVKLFVRGDRLVGWLKIPDLVVRQQLVERDHQVSVEVQRPHSAASPSNRNLELSHVGIVLNPVIPSQSPFQPIRSKGETKLNQASLETVPSEVDGAATIPVPETDANSAANESDNAPPPSLADIDVISMVEQLNSLLQRQGYSLALAQTTTADNLLDRLLLVLTSEGTMQMASTVTGPSSTQISLAAEDTTNVDLKSRQIEFERRVDQLVAQGRITPAERMALLESAEPARYRLSLLSPLDRLPEGSSLPIRSMARLSANAEPPRVPTIDHREDHFREIARSFGKPSVNHRNGHQFIRSSN